MKFDEALGSLRRKFRIRRKTWKFHILVPFFNEDGEMWYIRQISKEEHRGDLGWEYDPTLEDILKDDWEIYESSHR